MTPELRTYMNTMVDEANMLFAAGSTDKEIEDSMDKWLEFVDIEIKKAEQRVIDVAHSPCECGEAHYAMPVRSVQGGVTSYCVHRRVVLS